MSFRIPLSQLLTMVQDTIDAQFYGQAFWVTTEITDVKRYDSKNWCFCKLIEKKGQQMVAEIPGVFWQQGYQHIRRFEQATRRTFENGIEITCLATVKFHPRYGLKLEILEIDLSYTLGQLELDRQLTLQQLTTQFPESIRQVDDQYITSNNQLPLPLVIQRVALVTANHSDGQRDFIQELTQNAYGYHFRITGFYTTIQGEQAAEMLVKQLQQIAAKAKQFDVLALVRGGGSQTDFKPFEDFELAKTIAHFPIPVLTGIGHDRNTSIADLMARQMKTPTKVAATIVDHNYDFEQDLTILNNRINDSVESILLEKQQQLTHWNQQMKWMLPKRVSLLQTRLQHLNQIMVTSANRYHVRQTQQLSLLSQNLKDAAQKYRNHAAEKLLTQKRLIEQLGPEKALSRGFSITLQQGKIVTRMANLDKSIPVTTQMADGTFESEILSEPQ